MNTVLARLTLLGVEGRVTNKLFFGDNLDVLRERIPDESVNPKLSLSTIERPKREDEDARKQGSLL